MRCAKRAPWRLLAVVLVAAAPELFSAAEQSPGERIRALIHQDWTATRSFANGWPDLSPEGLRKLEERDKATLAALGVLPRNELNGDDRTLYDVFQWDLARRVESFRLRLYLTPLSRDSRFDSVSSVGNAWSGSWTIA